METSKAVISEHYAKIKAEERTGGEFMNWSEAVRVAKEGKEEGFNFLYQQTYQKSYYVALKYMKQEEAALDVLQDAYIKAFSSLEQLQDAEKFAGWFSRIVATKALDELKKRKVVLFSQLQTGDGEISMEELLVDERTDNQPELNLDKAETSRLVQEIIATLSDEQRMCIMMFYIEEMSVKEIAKILDVSENTVKSRLKYGRKNIEEKVLELEKKGTKLYGIAPLPFFLYLLLRDSVSAQTTQIPLSSILKEDSVSVKVGKRIALKATEVTIKKAVIGIVAGVAVCGGAAALIYSAIQNNVNVQETVNEAQMEEQQEEELETEKSLQTENSEEETQKVEAQETEPASEKWQEAYTNFANGLQADGNGYAVLDVAGSDMPILVVMPDVFNQTIDSTGWEQWGFESEEAFINAMNPIKLITEDSCIYKGGWFLELYFYDTETDEVKKISSAESDSPNGALVDFYMEEGAGFYLSYLPNEKLLVGDLVGSSIAVETYSVNQETENLHGEDTYVDENVEAVPRKDIIYYRTVEQALENVGAVQD